MQKYVFKPYVLGKNVVGVELNFNKELYVPEEKSDIIAITKEIKRILETIHLENVQSVGTKSFDEDKNKLSEVLKKVLQLLSRKIINFNLEFELKDAINLNILIRDAKDIVENRNNEMFSKITLIIIYRISEILFKTFFSNQIYGRNYYQTFN